MKLSPFFHDLRSAYQAEIDDLLSDSEGKDVLRRRLADKRAEMGFLVKMIDLAPEMVAVAFHQGFRFGHREALERLVTCGGDHIPAWGSLSTAVTLEPWAQPLAALVLREPGGERFLAIAAGLEYLHQQARMAPSVALAESDLESAEGDDADLDADDDGASALSADDAADTHTRESREEARDNWLADVGFDRKE